MSFLVDIGGLSPCSCNVALDGLYKAVSEDNHDIWAPHENLYIRDLVEWFTQRGITRHDTVHNELLGWLGGKYYLHGLTLPKPAHAPWGAWAAGDLELVRVYLQSLPTFGMEDAALLCDYLIQKHLAPAVISEEAEFLAVRANFLGRVQAQGIDPKLLVGIVMSLPSTITGVMYAFNYKQATMATLQYGWLHAAENVVGITDILRHQIKNTVVKHMAEMATGARPSYKKLQQELLDKFGDANRNWRRIAITEAGELANQGFIDSLPVGSLVQRLEAYVGACAWCQKINGQVFRVTTPDDPDKDGTKDIWVGKTNIGRSSSPYKKTDDGLVPRTEDEMYWVAAGVQHPMCRGRWLPQVQTGADPDFAAWLKNKIDAVG